MLVAGTTLAGSMLQHNLTEYPLTLSHHIIYNHFLSARKRTNEPTVSRIPASPIIPVVYPFQPPSLPPFWFSFLRSHKMFRGHRTLSSLKKRELHRYLVYFSWVWEIYIVHCTVYSMLNLFILAEFERYIVHCTVCWICLNFDDLQNVRKRAV